ncbi:coiled-coil and C2 domain-containing protein 1-like isoform X1 [Clavelina lepadiformis]|uniref:coiled-coil and C2 domain-containing protein 1-like isoform X1 n=1 Tax=Clavelina lepadiformis TaxID=159417 RepID=UPI00404273AF
MPRSKDKKSKDKSGRNDVLNMMGYGGGEEDDDSGDDMEAELASILGEGQPKSKKKPSPKLLDWSVVNAQIATALKDEDEGDDDEITAEDENDFMSELNDLVEEDEPALLKPVQPQRNRSPSPQPQHPGDTIDILKSRKEMYQKSMANAKAKGESAKVRRLERGAKTLDTLLRSAKAGKPIAEDDIPPVVAVGQAPSFTSSTSPSSQNFEIASASASTTPEQSSTNMLIDVSTTPPLTSNVQQLQDIKPTPTRVKVLPTPKVVETPVEDKPAINKEIITTLEERKLEYRDAALNAKRTGNKEAALMYFKILKQFDSVITAANEGKAIDISAMPPSLKKSTEDVVEKAAASPKPSPTETPPEQPSALVASQTGPPSKPKTVLEALEQRMQKYLITSEQAAKEGSSGKSRRMGRIAKQYKDAIRNHKAGRPVNFDELPVPPGFPPIPGMKENLQEESLMQKASALIQQDVDDEPGPSKLAVSNQGLAPQAVVPRKVSPRREESVSPAKAPSTRYDQQVVFLQNRQAAFKEAALVAKRKGDRAAAIDYLRKMKGFDSMIEAAKNGLKVDITNVPLPPQQSGGSKDEGFDIIEEEEIRDIHSKKSTPEEDEALYKRLLNHLQEQVKKARAYAQQMTHAGDVGGAERCDRLAASSQADYDYVKSCHRHRDVPPRFHYQEQVFQTIHLKPDIGSNEMELVMVQCIDLHTASKDGKVFVEWETPFPHDNPIKGKTDEGKGPQSPKFQDAIFRVPFTRKSKSIHRAVKNKSLKLEVIQKGGFLRSDKTIGSAAIKLSPLEGHCEIHAVEELKDGRNTVGKVEVFVRLRSPLLASDTKTMRERWLCIEHKKRSHNSSHAGKTSASAPRPSTGSSAPKINIASLDVLALELKIANAKIANYKKRGASPSKDAVGEARIIQQKIDSTMKFLKEGGSHARKEYTACLSRHYQHLTSEAQLYAKQGKREQAKLALSKKNLVKGELEKYASRT